MLVKEKHHVVINAHSMKKKKKLNEKGNSKKQYLKKCHWITYIFI